tara:strand:- start:79 stop:1332 length:1254 start_codon:yes stop_codon:yes gene_type:complete
MKNTFYKKKSIFLIIFSFLSTLSISAEKVEAYYSGFSFIANSGNLPKLFPYTYEISKMKEEGSSQSLLDAAARKTVIDNQPDKFSLNILGENVNQKASLAKGQSIVCSIAMDNETVSIEHIDDFHRVVIFLSAQILFFDFNEKSIIGSFPFRLQFQDVITDGDPRENEGARIKSLVEDLIINKDKFGLSLMDEFSKRIKNLELKEKYKSRIQVANVIVEEKSLHALPKRYSENSYAFKRFLGQSFSTLLSSNQDISVLPFVLTGDENTENNISKAGGAIGGRMTTTFANGDAYNLTIPEADFTIDFTLRGYKKVLIEEKAAGSSWVYGTYSKVKVYESLMNKVYFDEKIKNGFSTIIPASQRDTDHWQYFQESTLVLMDQLTKQFSKQEKSWAKKHGSGSKTLKQLKKTYKILEKCK